MESTFTFPQVAAHWKEDKRQYVKKATYAIYLQLLNNYILPAFGGDTPPDETAIQSFVNRMLADGYSIKTVKDTLLVLKMVLRHGTKLGAWPHIEYTIHFPTQVEKKSAPQALSKADQHRLQEYLRKNFSFRGLGVRICLHTGMRIGEICALQWKDLDINAGVIHVTKTVERIYIVDGDHREYSLDIDSPKTASSIRDIPISKDLMVIIRPLRKICPGEYYVISNADTPCEPRYYRDWFKKLLRELNITPVRFHALRHSFATRCIESRCDYKTVSAILGHSSISTTLDLYVHPGIDDKKRVIERMVKGLQ